MSPRMDAAADAVAARHPVFARVWRGTSDVTPGRALAGLVLTQAALWGIQWLATRKDTP